MYVPGHFREGDTQRLHEFIRRQVFGTLVVADQDGIEANHLPFYLDVADGNSQGVLECHLAIKNSVWQKIAAGSQILVIFQGPDAYVSPTWYPTKTETGRVVPTWNYLAVHAAGAARIIQDPAWLLSHLNRLTDHQEANRENPWAVVDAPADFIDRLIPAIIGVEIKIEQLTGKLKASQNQPEANRKGVREGLEREVDPRAHEMAKFL